MANKFFYSLNFSTYAFLIFFQGISLCLSSELIVSTSSPPNLQLAFQYHVPQNYSAEKQYTVLVYFGGRNTNGKVEASGGNGWGKWCDDNGVFILAPGFKNDNYWEPEKWSGQTLLDALAELKKNYNVETEHLLYYCELPVIFYTQNI